MPAKPAWMRDLDSEQVDFYLNLSAEVTVCRGKRRHQFPGIVPGKPLDEHVVVTRYHGVYQVTEYCRLGCGRWITYSAGRNGQPDYSTVRYRGWSQGKELATGLGLTAADDKAFMSYQQAATVAEGYQLQEKQRQAAAEAEKAAGQNGQPPAAKFQASA